MGKPFQAPTVDATHGLHSSMKARSTVPRPIALLLSTAAFIAASTKPLTVAISLSLTLASLTAHGAPITIVDLGPTTVFDVGVYRTLNDNGQVAGWTNGSDPTTTTTQAAVYSHGIVTGLGTLGGHFGYGNGINNAGRVVGHSYLTGDTAYHAALFTSGGPIDLGTLGGTNSSAIAINDAGLTVGVANLTGNSAQHAALFTRGGPIDLGTLGGAISYAQAINNSGQIVGASLTGDAAQSIHATLFTIGGSPIDLGTLGGTSSDANAINDRGLVVGYSSLTDIALGNTHAALFKIGGSPIDLGPLVGNSQAFGINDRDQVVGFATVGGQPHGVLWNNTNGVWNVTDLNAVIDPSSGWTVDFAYSINSQGWILAAGRKAGGVEHTLVLKLRAR